MSRSSREYCEEILSYIKARRSEKKIDLQVACNNTDVYKREYLSCIQDTKYRLQLRALAPDSYLIANMLNTKNIKNNQFSVVIHLKIGDLNVLFASDVENDTIRLVSSDWDLPEVFNYIKIPHHGSSSSSELLNVLEQNISSKGNIACSTAYRRANIPSNEILERYKNVAEKVICTSEIIGDRAVGIIKSSFNIARKEFKVETASK